MKKMLMKAIAISFTGLAFSMSAMAADNQIKVVGGGEIFVASSAPPIVFNDYRAKVTRQVGTFYKGRERVATGAMITREGDIGSNAPIRSFVKDKPQPAKAVKLSCEPMPVSNVFGEVPILMKSKKYCGQGMKM